MNLREIIEHGVDENIRAQSAGMQLNLETPAINVNFYVALDGKWTKIQEGTLTSVKTNGRYHISAAQLEAAYQDYGFTAASLNSANDLRFAHVDVDGANIWSCTPAKLVSDG